MPDEFIKTGVDDLLDLLKSVDKIPLNEAAKKLGVSQSLIQSWVDFLVEEEIVGIEYKFTKPLIYLNKTPQASVVSVSEEEATNIDFFKNDFLKRAEEKNIPPDKVPYFWKNHVKDVAISKKEHFFKEAKRRHLNNIDSLWDEYINALLNAA
ncbi:hypothetical protein JW711_03185 [Candidatus Woesearchaeota archaeon]|nr:hypothetical protein [Candidatus Woesearchaeota archaeon]